MWCLFFLMCVFVFVSGRGVCAFCLGAWCVCVLGSGVRGVCSVSAHSCLLAPSALVSARWRPVVPGGEQHTTPLKNNNTPRPPRKTPHHTAKNNSTPRPPRTTHTPRPPQEQHTHHAPKNRHTQPRTVRARFGRLSVVLVLVLFCGLSNFPMIKKIKKIKKHKK